MTKIIYPCDPQYRISQEWGVNKKFYSPFGLLGHDGIDIATPTGSNIYAVMDGTVKLLQEKKTGYGRLIVIEHDEFDSYYGHMTSFDVQTGQKVFAGQVIGLSGGGLQDDYRGNSTGPHLHFEIRPHDEPRNNGYAGAVNPFEYLLDRFYPHENWIGTVNTFYGLNVRDKPTTNSNIINRLRKGTNLKIWSIENDWAKIRSLRPEFVSSKFLNLVESKHENSNNSADYVEDKKELSVEERLDRIEKILNIQ